MSIAVIGGGIAGTAAAHEIARQGGRATVFHEHAGSSALYSGALDFEVWDRVSEFLPIAPDLAEFSAALGLWELGKAASRVATLEGNVRPTRGRDRALLDLEPCAGKRVGVVDLERDDWDARLLTRSFASSVWARQTHTRFEPVRVRALHANFERRTSAYDFSAAHDAPERLAFLVAAVHSAGPAPDAWLFGPWLGIERAIGAELSKTLGVPVGETTSAPGGAAGARFEHARDRLLARIADVARVQVTRVTRRSAGFRVATASGEEQKFSAVVLATGGVAAGGLQLERSFERRGGTGFRLSLAAPVAIELDHEIIEGVSSLSGVDFVEHGLAALAKVGIAVLEDGSARGDPGLFVAGDAVAARPRTALVAARSGLFAAQRALEYARVSA